MNRGALCISIDLELGWACWDVPSPEYFRLCAEKERDIVARMLKLFAAYDVSATWAVVGRLLERTDSFPVSSPQGECIWYAPELVNAIRDVKPAQDIGSHSFAHIYFHESEREAIRNDLNDARRVHEEHALDFTSFVFPRNQVSHIDLLASAGIRVFRSVDVGWHAVVRHAGGRLAGRLAHRVNRVVPVPPAVVQPILHNGGLVELPSSLLLMERYGMRRLVWPEIAVVQARLGLRAAQRSGGTFHLWFHPSNFYYDTDVQLRLLESVLRTAAGMRDLGQLDIRPMKSYAQAGKPEPFAG